jgi:hypothetical protein
VSLTYVYCLVRSPRRPALRGVPEGVTGGGPVRLLDAGNGLWAVVASVPDTEYSETALNGGLADLDWVGQRALAHEAVVEHFLGSPAVLPMQLFTLFASDERALQHLARDRRQIDRILLTIERQLEWGLRLTFDEHAVVADAAPVADVSGAAYLTRKRDLLDAARNGRREALGAAEQLFAALAKDASAARRRTDTEQIAPGSRVLLDAAFLVPARRSAGFRAALRRHAKRLGGSGVVVSLTGPWPPYNFITPLPKRTARTVRAAAAVKTAPAARRAPQRKKTAR